MTPGLHFDIDAATYHADPCPEPSLSSSIAKVLLKDTPRHAWTKHPRLNPNFEPDVDDKFDLGSVVHELVLGKGAGFDVLDFKDWRSGDAKKAREASRAIGRTPVLAEQFERANAIYSHVNDFVMRNYDAHMDWTEGRSEVVAIWRDVGGPLCRAMLDRFCPRGVVYDVKTTEAGLSDSAIDRSIEFQNYDLSAAFYLRGLLQLQPDLAGRLQFAWLFVEISEPFECRLIEADASRLAIGDRKAALAIEKWRKCVEAKHWPGYPAAKYRLPPPDRAESRWLEREIADNDSLRMHVLDRTPAREPQKLMEPV